MADSFFHRFVQKLGVVRAREQQRAPLIDATVFGKHPAWNDHIPELSADSDRLVNLKRVLYEGITGNVDNGEWDKLEKSGQLQPYGHSFLFTGLGEPVAGRIWYSRDGKGRDRYPMMAAMLCGGVPLSFIAAQVFPVLMQLQAQCSAATSAQEVKSAQDAAEDRVRRLAAAALQEPSPPPEPGYSETLSYLAGRPEVGLDRSGLFRVLYHLERELPPDKPSLSRAPFQRAVTLRVPPCADSPAASAEVWTRFLEAKVGGALTILALAPDAGGWLDAIIGPAGAAPLYCLRAPLDVLPFTTEIPYSLDPEFVKRSEKAIEESLAATAAAKT